MSKRTETPNLLKALEFIALAQRDTGAPYQTHVLLRNNCAVAYDGVLAAGHRIDEDLNACPHTMTLVSALKKCQGALSVAQLDSGRISVKSGRFRALVPCQPDAIIQGTAPDPVCGQMDNRIRDALAVVSPFVIENSQRLMNAAALLRANSVLAVNGSNLIVEYWHGINLPQMLVPKLFITALTKINKNIVSFGFSPTSLTVYFEDTSWLKTQLYNERYPDCDSVLSKPHSPQLLPVGFYEAFNTIVSFVKDGRIFIKKNRVQTDAIDELGASYEVDGLDANVAYSARQLKLLDGCIKTIDFKGHNGVSYFYGDNLRGAIGQMEQNNETT